MNQLRLLNPTQPQTLYIATILCYWDGISGLLFGDVIATSTIIAVFTIFGLLAGGVGIANEKRWGYTLAVAAATSQVLGLLLVAGGDVFRSLLILSLVFDVALVALLVHPMSREYQRIWFK